MSKVRVAVAALTLSATAFIGLVSHEGYVDRAMVPTQGDRPTLGFGSTFNEDGSPVKMGDTTTPVRALVKAQAHIAKEEAIFRECLGDVALAQHEWDAYISWVYNVGTGAACKSTLVRKLKTGDYEGACNELLRWTLIGGRQLRGLVIRREHERHQCLGLAPQGSK